MAKGDKNKNDILDEETGEVVMDENDILGDASAVQAKDGDKGFTIRAFELKEGKSITGYFRGFVPFEYADDDKGRKDTRDGKVVLSWVILDVLNPKTGKSMGIIGKIMGSTRILGDLAFAVPGDKICIARFGQIELGKNRMWDDVTRIFPTSERNTMPIAISAKAITSHKELDEFKARNERLLPGSTAATVTVTKDDIDQENIRNQNGRAQA